MRFCSIRQLTSLEESLEAPQRCDNSSLNIYSNACGCIEGNEEQICAEMGLT